MSRRVLLIFVLCVPAGDVVASCPAAPPAERRYAGATLAKWRVRIKNIDFNSSAGEALVPGLIEIVEDREAPWVSRRQAAETLGRLGTRAPEGVAVLLRVLDEPSDAETPPRVWGLKALSLYGSAARDAAPTLSRILRDTECPLYERQLALEALAQIGPAHSDAIPDIIGMLTLRDPAGPAAASGAAIEASDSAARARSDAIELRELAVESFTLIGPAGAPAIPALVRLFEESSDVLRMKTAQAIGAMGPRGEIAVTMLAERLLFDDSPLVRDAAADALARIGTEALPALVQLLGDTDAETRWRAAAALGKMGRAARPAVEPLTERLDDDSPVVRLRAAEALWQVTSDAERVLPAALRALADRDRRLRLDAVRLFETMGRRAHPALPELRELARDKRPAVRQAADKVLEKLGTP